MQSFELNRAQLVGGALEIPSLGINMASGRALASPPRPALGWEMGHQTQEALEISQGGAGRGGGGGGHEDRKVTGGSYLLLFLAHAGWNISWLGPPKAPRSTIEKTPVRRKQGPLSSSGHEGERTRQPRGQEHAHGARVTEGEERNGDVPACSRERDSRAPQTRNERMRGVQVAESIKEEIETERDRES